MEPEQKFVVVTVIVLVMLSLLSLGGCDYWPPALQAEIEQLRTHLNDVLDENGRLHEELAALKAAATRLTQHLEFEPDVTRMNQPSPPVRGDVRSLGDPSRDRTGSSSAAVPAAGVVKRPPLFLTLTQPPQRGPEVVKLQRLLRRHAMPVHVDGVYGLETAAAIRSFQRRHHLEPDGIAGPATYAALRRPPSLVRSITQVRLQRPPVVGNHVTAIQSALRRAGYRVTADGRYGPETAAAIKRFQHRHGLVEDGIIGPDTWRALMRRDAARQVGQR